jgi:hypothetical protein
VHHGAGIIRATTGSTGRRRSDGNEKTHAELYAEARRREIANCSKMTKG